MSPKESSFLPQGPTSKILQAALLWTTDHGLYKLTMAEVARQAGVSRPFLNYHYQSLEEILEALAQIWARSGQQVTTEVLSKFLGAQPKDLILKIVEATFIWKKECPHLAALTPSLNQLAITQPKIASLIEKTTGAGIDRMQSILMNDKKGEDAAELAPVLHMQLVGGFLYHLSTRHKTDKEMEKDIKDAMLFILRKN